MHDTISSTAKTASLPKRCELKVSQNLEVISKWSDEALDRILYVPGRLAKYYFEEKRHIKIMSVAFLDGRMIGWGIFCRELDCWRMSIKGQRVFGAFVHNRYRHRGIATALINLIHTELNIVPIGLQCVNRSFLCSDLQPKADLTKMARPYI
jgi:GNAT superfamily N-acetyltransferase